MFQLLDSIYLKVRSHDPSRMHAVIGKGKKPNSIGKRYVGVKKTLSSHSQKSCVKVVKSEGNSPNDHKE